MRQFRLSGSLDPRPTFVIGFQSSGSSPCCTFRSWNPLRRRASDGKRASVAPCAPEPDERLVRHDPLCKFLYILSTRREHMKAISVWDGCRSPRQAGRRRRSPSRRALSRAAARGRSTCGSAAPGPSPASTRRPTAGRPVWAAASTGGKEKARGPSRERRQHLDVSLQVSRQAPARRRRFDSAANLDHVQTVDRSRLVAFIGTVGPAKMQRICSALALATGCA